MITAAADITFKLESDGTFRLAEVFRLRPTIGRHLVRLSNIWSSINRVG